MVTECLLHKMFAQEVILWGHGGNGTQGFLSVFFINKTVLKEIGKKKNLILRNSIALVTVFPQFSKEKALFCESTAISLFSS